MNPSSDSITLQLDPKWFVDGDRHSSIGMLVNIIQLEILTHTEKESKEEQKEIVLNPRLYNCHNEAALAIYDCKREC